MKKICYASAIAFAVFTAFPLAGFSQTTTSPEKGDSSFQEIIIRRKGDHSKKLDIQVNGDEILINGKKTDDPANGDVSVTERSISQEDHHDFIMRRFHPRGGLQMFDVPSSPNANKALLGVISASDNNKGAKITEVEEGTAADKAGLKEGDVISKVGDKTIQNPADLVDAIGAYKPDDKVQITYQRDNQTHTVTATLGENNEEAFFGPHNNFNFPDLGHSFGMMPPDGGNHNFRFYTFPDSNRPHLGLTIQNEKEDKGVQVMRVMPGSPAEKAGVKKGDVITGINDKTVHSSDDLTDALQDHADDEQLNLQVLRNGESKTLQLSLQPARPMINL